MSESKLRRKDLIEPELSYQIVGAILDAYHGLGSGLKEVTYQKAVAKALLDRGLSFKEQVSCPVKFKNEKIGNRYLDFLVSDKIIIELKRGDNLSREHILQVKEYLIVTKLKLAILATITSTGVRFRRIINIS